MCKKSLNSSEVQWNIWLRAHSSLTLWFKKASEEEIWILLKTDDKSVTHTLSHKKNPSSIRYRLFIQFCFLVAKDLNLGAWKCATFRSFHIKADMGMVMLQIL